MIRNGSLKGLHEYSERSPYFAEFFRLYSRIQAPRDGKHPRIFMVTSAVAGEGKTTVSTYLGITAALATRKTHLIIDADLNRPTLHFKLGLEQANGLTEILGEGLELTQAIQTTTFPGLHVISAGHTVPNPFQLLSAAHVGDLFTHLQGYYESIFVDSPPILNVGDTLKLAEYVDGILLVILSGRTNREVVKRATEMLREIDKPVLGVVLNDMGEVLPYYYQHKYYSYHYVASEKSRTGDVLV
ncbi:MAG TPA: CpsD/CapB family tyrosine-protein kinase [bacterium]|nr:CpsD/CapB family tyrosine-protein kinase [bacterium]HPR88701.1 CpsD/CapB family tyrosine-protein kinase [bacterium]